ncbi:atpD, partial [Symbiodinium sp. CCMP2456]
SGSRRTLQPRSSRKLRHVERGGGSACSWQRRCCQAKEACSTPGRWLALETLWSRCGLCQGSHGHVRENKGVRASGRGCHGREGCLYRCRVLGFAEPDPEQLQLDQCAESRENHPASQA